MNLYNLFKGALLSGVWLAAVSCNKNFEQEFNYNKINEASISADLESYTVTQFDHLSIKPKLNETVPAGDAYTFTWNAYLQFNTPVLLSKEKDLEVDVELSPGTYTLQLTATNTTTGIKSFKVFQLVVNGAFQQGWYITHNKEGKPHLSFIRSDKKVFASPAEDINNKVYPGTAISSFYSSAGFVLMFTTAGAFRFNPDNFMETGSNNQIIPGKTTYKKSAYLMGLYKIDQYIIDNGGLHAGFGPLLFPDLVADPFTERFPGDYDLFPAVIASQQLSTRFYDNKNRRFVQVEYAGRAITQLAPTATAAYNVADVKKTMIACDLGPNTSASATYYFVMEDENGRYVLSMAGTTPGLNIKVDYSKCPGFETATCFATSSVFDHLYYASGNKIYFYVMGNNTAELLYEFPAGYDISQLKMLRSTSKRLAVGANNSAGGEVYYFDIDAVGRFANQTYAEKYSGFGRIEHLSNR